MAFRAFGCPFAVVNKTPIRLLFALWLSLAFGVAAFLPFVRRRNIHYVRRRYVFYLFNAAAFSAARAAFLADFGA